MNAFFKQSLFANLTTVAVIGLGIVLLLNMKREVFPPIDFDLVQVTTPFPGASPEQVERLVTTPVEDEIKGVFGIRDLFSTSVEGLSTVTVVIDPDYRDKDEVVTEVQRAIDRVEDLPELVDRPVATEIKSVRQPSILFFLRQATDFSDEYIVSLELREMAQRLETEIESVDGIGDVTIQNENELEYLVEFKSQELKRLGISVDEVVQAFRTQNITVPAGEIEKADGTFRYRIENELLDIEKINKVVLRATVDGQVFTVGDLAKITLRQEEGTYYGRTKGTPSAVLGIIKKEESDVIDAVDRAKERAEAFIAKVNEKSEIKYELSYGQDLTVPVRVRLKALGTSIAIGGILVFLILLLALNWRTAVIVAVGIPFSFLGAVLMMPQLDFSLNLLTMFGFVVVLGMIVDDAIVVSESIFSELEKGASKLDAARDGTLKVIKPVLGSVMTSILAFGPLVFMTGIFGKFVTFIPSIVILCLFVSLLEAFFLLPNHMRDFSKVPDEKSKTKAENHPFEVIRVAYRKIIKVCIRWRYLVGGLSAVFVIVAVVLHSTFGRFELFPREGIDTFFVIFEGDTKLSLKEVAERIKPIEKLVSTYPEDEVLSFVTNIGRIETEGRESRKQGSNYGQISVFLVPQIERDLDIDEMIAAIEEELKNVPDMETVRVEKAGAGPPSGRPVNVVFSHPDLEVLREVTQLARAELETIEGVKSIGDTDTDGKTEYIYAVDFNRVLQAGVNSASVGRGLQMAVDGAIVGQVRSSDEKIDLRVRMSDEETPEESLAALSVLAQTGELVPLSSLISVESDDSGIYAINHYQAQRSITVFGDVEEEVITATVANERLSENFREWRVQYPGLNIYVLGENRDTEESLQSLQTSLMYALVLVFCVMVLTLGSLWQPIMVILGSVPFGIAGVLIVFLVHNKPLSFLAFFGMVGLIGVAVNVGIVLVDRINQLMLERDFREALVEGSVERLRPVLLTSATTVLGLMPTAYGWGGGDPFLKPMALALGWGIAFSTILGIIVTPILLAMFFDLQRLFFGHTLKVKDEADLVSDAGVSSQKSGSGKWTKADESVVSIESAKKDKSQ